MAICLHFQRKCPRVIQTPRRWQQQPTPHFLYLKTTCFRTALCSSCFLSSTSSFSFWECLEISSCVLLSRVNEPCKPWQSKTWKLLIYLSWELRTLKVENESSKVENGGKLKNVVYWVWTLLIAICWHFSNLLTMFFSKIYFRSNFNSERSTKKKIFSN